ncbi:Uncharacterised protein [Shigella sonnei]|nr:Uncharacterised protein [Shigella sonnei]CSG41840.1 Uncharacterised protein [Shigella sonnei]
MEIIAGQFCFLHVEHVLGDIGKTALRQGFHHFQAVPVFIDNLLGELDVFHNIALRHIF